MRTRGQIVVLRGQCCDGDKETWPLEGPAAARRCKASCGVGAAPAVICWGMACCSCASGVSGRFVSASLLARNHGRPCHARAAASSSKPAAESSNGTKKRDNVVVPSQSRGVGGPWACQSGPRSLLGEVTGVPAGEANSGVTSPAPSGADSPESGTWTRKWPSALPASHNCI